MQCLICEHKNFKSTLNLTGSQCKDFRIGVICSFFLAPVRILAAEFCTHCKFIKCVFRNPNKKCIAVVNARKTRVLISLSVTGRDSIERSLAIFLR